MHGVTSCHSDRGMAPLCLPFSLPYGKCYLIIYTQQNSMMFATSHFATRNFGKVWIYTYSSKFRLQVPRVSDQRPRQMATLRQPAWCRTKDTTLSRLCIYHIQSPYNSEGSPGLRTSNIERHVRQRCLYRADQECRFMFIRHRAERFRVIHFSGCLAVGLFISCFRSIPEMLSKYINGR